MALIILTNVFIWLALFAIFAFAQADDKCEEACSYNYDPVCAKPKAGIKAFTFGNECAVRVYACQQKSGEFKFRIFCFSLYLTNHKFLRIRNSFNRRMPRTLERKPLKTINNIGWSRSIFPIIQFLTIEIKKFTFKKH